jgi:adenine-specific DNA-methyltransferase
MLTGARAECPEPGDINKWLLAPQCGFAVVHKEELFQDVRAELNGCSEIGHVFLVTDSEDAFKEMRTMLRKGSQSYMLYSSYLRNFGINTATTS